MLITRFVKKLTFMKKRVPLTTTKIVQGALKGGGGGRLKSPHRCPIQSNYKLGLMVTLCYPC